MSPHSAHVLGVIAIHCAVFAGIGPTAFYVWRRYLKPLTRSWPDTVQDINGQEYQLLSKSVRQVYPDGDWREAKREDIRRVFGSRDKDEDIPAHYSVRGDETVAGFKWRAYIEDYQLHIGCKHFGDEATLQIERWARSSK